MDLEKLERNWNEFGNRDPLWAILTNPEYAGNKGDPRQFFDTGRQEIERLLRLTSALGLETPKRRALDFGCGVGRLTQALAGHFDAVTGIDIAASMIRGAERYNQFGRRCTYVHIPHGDLSQFEADSFDLIYTRLVLQHMEPQFAKAYLRAFLRLLTPDGLLVFQIPSERVGSAGRLKSRLGRYLPVTLRRAYRAFRHRGDGGPVMEMHSIPIREMVEFLPANGAELMACLDDSAADTSWKSYLYVVRRARR